MFQTISLRNMKPDVCAFSLLMCSLVSFCICCNNSHIKAILNISILRSFTHLQHWNWKPWSQAGALKCLAEHPSIKQQRRISTLSLYESAGLWDKCVHVALLWNTNITTSLDSNQSPSIHSFWKWLKVHTYSLKCYRGKSVLFYRPNIKYLFRFWMKWASTWTAAHYT